MIKHTMWLVIMLNLNKPTMWLDV